MDANGDNIYELVVSVYDKVSFERDTQIVSIVVTDVVETPGEGVTGTVVFPALEGTRPVLVEIQALVVRLASGATRYYWTRARDQWGNPSGFARAPCGARKPEGPDRRRA